MRLRSTSLLLLPAVLATLLATAETRVRVTAEHTNLRYQNADNVEIACVLPAGQELLVHGDIEGNWLPVTPPDDIHVWIYGELVRKGRVVRDKAQLRCGPGLSFKVVGSVNQGVAIESRGRSGDWVKIKPPAGLLLWVSRTAVAVLPTNTMPVVSPLPPDLATGLLSALQDPTNRPTITASLTNNLMAPPALAPAEAAPTNRAPAAPIPPTVITNRAPSVPWPPALAALPRATSPVQGQRLRFHGTLRASVPGATAAPSRYRLTNTDRAGGLVTTCQILTDHAAFATLSAGTVMTLEGPAWWLKDEANPVVRMESFTVEK
jgi:uncharacterized protein YgiM (DUF1202 family)